MDEKFETVWQALVENGSSMRNHDATERFWNTLSPQQQDLAHRNIPRKVREGKFVQYDPIRAIKENIRQVKVPAPKNYNGVSNPDKPIFSAKYNGAWGMYTEEDIETYQMERYVDAG